MALTTRRQHSGGAIQTTLSVGIGAGDLSITLAASTGWPDGSIGPFFAVLDRGLTGEEKILITSRSANVLTVTSRGADGTTATTHASGAAIFPVWTAIEADEANAHSSTGTAVHGVAGALVGAGDVQTLTNKSIDFGSNTITGEPVTIGFGMPGACTVRTSNIEYLVTRPLSLTGFLSRINAGTGVSVQLLKNGASAGNPSVGVFTTATTQTFAAVAYARGDRLGVQITNAGSSASDLSVSCDATFTA
jgi:hypothetical protein